MKKISWLEDFAESRKKSATKQKTTVASKKVAKKSIASADMIIIAKSMLPKAVNGNTVKYQNVKWKVVNASYKDAKGEGIVMKKVAGIDTKPLTSPETRAYTDPGAVYDYNVRETSEISDFEEAARKTEEQIAKEDSVDHDTTPQARYQNPVLMDESAPVETDEVVPDAEVTDEVPSDEDVPVVEEDTEEAPVEEEIPVDDEAEDNFTFDDVDEEPFDNEEKVSDDTEEVHSEDEVPVEEDTDTEDEEKKPVAASKKVAKKRKNPILMAMLKH